MTTSKWNGRYEFSEFDTDTERFAVIADRNNPDAYVRSTSWMGVER